MGFIGAFAFATAMALPALARPTTTEYHKYGETLTKHQCEKITNEFGLIPWITWGNTPDDMKAPWDASDCNHKMCLVWAERYGIKPFKSWGEMPDNLKASYDHPEMQCNLRITPYNRKQCDYISTQFGLIPYITWGSTPGYVQPLWDAADCNHKMCRVWQKRYDIKPFESWGAMPENLQASWDNPEMQCNDVVKNHY